MSMTPLQALEEAVRVTGGQTALARKIGKRQQDVWNWLNVAGRVSPENVLAIEAATGVSKHDLRPDLYPLD